MPWLGSRAAADAGLHAAGFFAYELGYVLEPKLADPMPGGAERPAAVVRALQQSPRNAGGRGRSLAGHAYRAAGPINSTSVTRAWDQAEYEQRFSAVQDKIRAGDIYQLNLTFKARFRLEGSPLTFYRDLRQRPARRLRGNRRYRRSDGAVG